ncbi:MAG: pyridoxamine 5'-phosphate oxidase [Actinomycetota bacterium]|nr:pyridoxamine 5'-phosphate oxidase [Actinomycetota bacterium]
MPSSRADAPLAGGDPIARFTVWFREAGESGIALAEAMTLATATAAGAPSARTVLLKGVDERGFVFYTNYESRKGRELAENPRAALVFHWSALGRQVRVEGRVARVSAAESDSYFVTRPRESRLAAWASRQSEAVESRQAIEARFSELEARFRDREVPRPSFWGGYRLLPETIEFWQHGENRLHDRFRYRRSGRAWTVDRLAP